MSFILMHIKSLLKSTQLESMFSTRRKSDLIHQRKKHDGIIWREKTLYSQVHQFFLHNMIYYDSSNYECLFLVTCINF